MFFEKISNYIIDVENSKGYIVIRVDDSDEKKIEINSLKDDSPLLEIAMNKNPGESENIFDSGVTVMLIDKKVDFAYKKGIENNFNHNDFISNYCLKYDWEKEINFLCWYKKDENNVVNRPTYKILEFKKNVKFYGQEKNSEFEFIEKSFEKELKKLAKTPFLLVAVPSHTAKDHNDSSVAKMIRNVSLREPEKYYDGSNILFRISSVEKSAGNTKRPTKEEHKKSMKLSQSVYNKDIVLVDDVFTTGNTMNACKEILIENGARRVILFPLSKT